MKNFNSCLFLLAVGISTVSGQKGYSSENETASEAPKNNTKAESDSKAMGENAEKHHRQGFLITPDERLLIDERFFQTQRQRFFEEDDYIPTVKLPIGGKRQNVHLTDDSGSYDVQLENFQHENPTYFQAALGAISAHIINQKNQEYIPYPPNGDPHNHPAYRGHPRATEPPVIRAYERSGIARYDAQPHVGFNGENPGRVFASNIHQRSFPESENFGTGFYAGSLFNNGALEQVRNSERINKWYEDQRGGRGPAERVFFGP